jgi:hypothetical protein
MPWNVEITDEFSQWWTALVPAVQDKIEVGIGLLELLGPSLGRPHADTLKGSRHENMKELRVQQGGKPYRIFFAFDPRRTAIILLGGCKAGDKQFYVRMVPLADDLYEAYIKEIRKEGLIP